MLKDELLIISAYKGMEQTIFKLCAQMNIEPGFMEWEMAEPAFIAALKSRFRAEGMPDVIITRGAMANMVEENFSDIILVRAEPGGMDLVNALCRARVHSRQVGALVQERDAAAYHTDEMCRALGLEKIVIHPFRTKEDIENQIYRCRDEGLDAAVGGGSLAERVGRAINYPVFAAQTGELALQSAIYQALGILAVRRKEKRYLSYFRSASSFVNEGIVVLNSRSVTFMNDVAKGIFASGQDIPAFSSQVEKESLRQIGGKNYLVRKEEIVSSDGMHTMLILHDANRIQLQEHKIRTGLRTKGFEAKYHLRDIQSSSASMRTLLDSAVRYAHTDGNILITGESGTGKELLAQSIHNASARANGPFIAVNCAAIPETLLESELFGYEEGAFSGAKKSGKPGMFELAHQGTIFLDEIDSMPARLQGVLLRVLQEKEVHRIGAQSNLAVDCRVLAATNKDLHALMERNEFRPDLYYRLNIFRLKVPPLRDRQEDILLLAEHFIRKYAELYQIRAVELTQHEQEELLRYFWPGNVRELENTMQRYVMLSDVGPVALKECMDDAPASPGASSAGDGEHYLIRRAPLEEMERELISQCTARHGGNRTSAAEELDISRSTLWKKLQ